MSTDALPWAAFNSDQDKYPTKEQTPKNAVRLVYLTRRRPCWHCSKPLATVTTGPNKGKYVGVAIQSQGYERLVHALCESLRMSDNDIYHNSDYLARHPEMLEELKAMATITNRLSKQAFSRGDLVHISKDLGPSMSHFIADQDAIVMGSYADQYGGTNRHDFTLFIRGSGEVAWYQAHQLTLIEINREDLIELWKAEEELDRQQKSNLDWIFSHGSEVYQHGYGASLQALADCLNLGSLWGPHGEGITYYINANYIRQLSGAWLQTNDKEGWLSFCHEALATLENCNGQN